MNANWKAWIVAVAIFVTGVGIGSTVTTWIGIRQLRPNVAAAPQNRSAQERALQRIESEIQNKLSLTAEESQRVNVILRETGANLRGVRTQAARDAVAELRAAAKRISAELPQEKREEFRKLIMRRFQRIGLPERSPGSGHPDPENASERPVPSSSTKGQP